MDRMTPWVSKASAPIDDMSKMYKESHPGNTLRRSNDTDNKA